MALILGDGLSLERLLQGPIGFVATYLLDLPVCVLLLTGPWNQAPTGSSKLSAVRG